MSQEEKKAQARQKLAKGLEILESFTAEEGEEIRCAIKADPKLRKKTERALARLREIVGGK